MKRVILWIWCSLFLAVLDGSAQCVIDLTKDKEVSLCLDGEVERIDTVVIQKNKEYATPVRYANLLMNDSILMLGASDGQLYRIKDGSHIRPFDKVDFGTAQLMGVPAVHPGSAWLDSSGQYCYARGNSLDGVVRNNYIKKLNFYTGEMLDSIPINHLDFSLSLDDSLRIATGHEYLTCFPEYTFIVPEGGRVSQIRYCSRSKMWLKLIRNKKTENWLCSVDGTQIECIKSITYQGKDIDPNSFIGFAFNKWASATETPSEFIVTIYHLKKN